MTAAEGAGGAAAASTGGAAVHASIGLDPDACTSCMLCARECPDWCIHIDSHPESEAVDPTVPGARPRTVHVLDRFAIDFGLCMYCGICIEVCPFDALRWSPEPVAPGASTAGLVLERDALAALWPGRDGADA